jgi:colanic acid/amylovoran biosynthesis protein
MKKYYLHSNGDAKNHVCEAIIRGTVKILDLNKNNSDYASFNQISDYSYGLQEIIHIVPVCRKIPIKGTFDYYFSKLIRKFSYDYFCEKIVGDAIKKSENHSIAIALGGGTYKGIESRNSNK